MITVAGDGTAQNTSGPALNSSLYRPRGMVFDGNGNLYFVADGYIRVLTKEGELLFIAGNSSFGFQDGTKGGALFNGTQGLAVGLDGNIYAVDTENNRIRKVTPEGVVTTFAGSGSSMSLDGTGTDAAFNLPHGIAVDKDGNLYISEIYGHKIRKITPEGVTSTLAGSGTSGTADGTGTEASFDLPTSISLDPAGNLYVATSRNTIRKVSADGVVTTVAGSGTNGSANGNGTAASFNQIGEVAVDPQGNLFIVDQSFELRRLLNSNGFSLTGSPEGLSGDHNVELMGDDLDGGTATQAFTITITDETKPVFTSGNAATVTENTSGVVFTAVATDTRPLSYGLGTDKDESLFSIDTQSGAISFVSAPDFEIPADADMDNQYLLTLTASDGKNVSSADLVIQVTNISDTDPVFNSIPVTEVEEDAAYEYEIITSDIEADKIVISATTLPDWLSLNRYDGGTVATFAGSGTDELVDGTGTLASFTGFGGITTDADNNVYVSDFTHHVIRKISPEGIVTTIAGSGTAGSADGMGTNASFFVPTGMEVDSEGNLYVAEYIGGRIRKIAPSGEVTTFAGSGTNASIDGAVLAAGFSQPYGIAINSLGDVYVVEEGKRIRKISDGIVSTFVESDVFEPIPGGETVASNRLGGVAFDSQNNLFVSDVTHRVIRKITPTATVTVFAGSGMAGTADGTGTEADFFSPVGLDIDQEDNLYVADLSNNLLRKISALGRVTTLAGGGPGNDGDVNGLGSDARFLSLNELAVDNNGKVFLLDNNFKIKSFVGDAPRDYLSGNATAEPGDYPVEILASDAAAGMATQSFSITILDTTVPVFTSSGSVSVAENTTGVIYTASATDNEILTYSMGTDADEGSFHIDATSGALSFVAAPDFELPLDADKDNVYQLEILASDSRNTAEFMVAITVTDVDEITPVFTSGSTVIFAENSTGIAYTAVATDANTVTYSLGTGNDESLFDIDGSKGDIGFKASPDFEAPDDSDGNNVYVLEVLASDGLNVSSQLVEITVMDVDEIAPAFTSGSTANFAENSTGIAYTAVATDANTVTYSLGTGNDESLFDIDGSKGDIGFKTSPDFEAPEDSDGNNVYVLEVLASDGMNVSSQLVEITVTDVDEITPVFTSGSTVNFAENSTGIAYTAVATDANTVTYILGTGNDESLFGIDGSKGDISFKASPDFEAPEDSDGNNVYVLEVLASDALNVSSQFVEITVTDVDEITPVFTSGSTVNFAENSTGIAYTAVATDANTVTYSLGTGNDESLFDIDSSKGDIGFKASPDFEVPDDSDGNNVYVLEVLAYDALNVSSQLVEITVTDVDDTAPVITSASALSIPENTDGIVYTAVATDVNTVTYSLGTGNDESLFDIDENTGAVNFVATPDFEAPTDANADNVYMLEVIAGDGLNDSNLVVSLTVTNVADTPMLRVTGDVTLPETGINESSTFELTLHNDGEGDLIISTLNYPEAFSGPEPAITISTGGSQLITVTFMPTERQTYSGDIEIESNGGISTIAVTGEGVLVTSLEPEAGLKLVKMYPNPANNELTIDLSEIASGKRPDIVILDMKGQKQFELRGIIKKLIRVDVSGFPGGVYLVRVSNEDSVTVKKIIIKD